MAGPKRKLDDGSSSHKSKKSKPSVEVKTNHERQSHKSTLLLEEVDFPRGGGTSFTPLEVKTIRAEAVKEANEELFEEDQGGSKLAQKRKRKSEAKEGGVAAAGKSDRIRIEHLNYKRMSVGMKILGQVASIQPLALIVSLPNQLYAHVPITHISSQLTSLLESMDEDEQVAHLDEEQETLDSKPRVPDLFEIFSPGQYVRGVVTAIHAPGSSDITGVGKARDDTSRSSRRVELSLVPEKVNAGVHKTDLRMGFTLSAAIKSVEDHGYILDLGLPDVTGFLSFKYAEKGPFNERATLHVGRLLDVSVTKLSDNGRTCNVTVDPATFSSSSLSEVTNVTSILPGTLVQSLVTAVQPTGLNLQVLGFFEGTVDQFHLRHDTSDKSYQTGKKLKARVLYDFSTSPPKFGLSLAEHVLGLGARLIKGKETSLSAPTIQEAYPVGTILEAVRVLRTESERGLIVEIQPGLEGFVHISQTSEDHVPSLSSSSGPWKVGTTHKARVTGHYPMDGLLQLSLKKSVLDQKFLQVGDVQVGEVIQGTVKKLTETCLFVSMSRTIDGVVWPNHYADITLKHPAKRFKTGGTIKCRVLVVDQERKRVALTAKKTLLDSTLPILSKFEDVKVGAVAHAVVFNISDRRLTVEFYNKLKATVPLREASETAVDNLSNSFAIGKVVKVRIISVDPDNLHIVASIRQAASDFKSAITDISGVEIGNIVEGVVSEIHKENAIITLRPTETRALISLNNLANHRLTPLPQLRVALKVGDKLEELVVVSRFPEKGFVIVANRPKAKAALPPKGSLSMASAAIGQIVGGRVTRHNRNGAHVKLTTHIGGTLHPTDTADKYELGTSFPAVDSILKAVVIGIDLSKNQLALSTRHSRMYPDQEKPVVDREIKAVSDLTVGETIRGFIKSVAEHGLFVTLGPNVDARVQIKELFDEYVKDWKSRFEANQIVKGRILSVDVENRKVEMSFRSENLTSTTSLTLADLRDGQKVDGRVKKIEDYGLFIEIDGSRLSGLCHKSQLSDNKDADVSLALRSFHEGDRVKAIVLSIDIAKRRLSLGLKPSYFVDDEDKEEMSGDEEPDSDTFGVVEEDEDEDLEIGNDGTAPIDDEDTQDDSMQVDLDIQSTHGQDSAATLGPSGTPIPPLALKLQGRFQWFGNHAQSDNEVGSDSSSDETDGEQSGKKKKKKRARKGIEQDLTADMHTKTPESNADFERVLLGSPNSSYLWIQYMSFQLQLSEVDKAREVARRALQTINFREEQEKLNVWIASLNLENLYGSDETLEDTFKQAARHNDSKTVHLRLAFIFDQTQKHDKAEEQYKRTCKKFGQSSKVWTLFGEHYLQRGDAEQARKLLPRSLQSLDKQKHLKVISKFAQLEYKLGDPERGKTIFEGIVDSHPKRWDVWSIYMDMEAGQGSLQSLRNLFDRVLALKMTSHKAKYFFKKWLDLERRLGDEEGATTVKQKAIEWTQRAANST